MINYPFLNENYKKITSYRNRGMSFEERINITNNYYLNNDIALIFKRTTPIKVIEFNNQSKLITKAVFEKDSTTDYNGVYKGRYLDFEAKSVTSKTSFPLHNIKEHQITHLKDVIKNGGTSFFLIEFSTLNKIYLLKTIDLLDYINSSNKKSISLKDFEIKAFRVNQYINKPVDYLENIEKIFKF